MAWNESVVQTEAVCHADDQDVVLQVAEDERIRVKRSHEDDRQITHVTCVRPRAPDMHAPGHAHRHAVRLATRRRARVVQTEAVCHADDQDVVLQVAEDE